MSGASIQKCGVFASYTTGHEQIAYAGYKNNIAAFLHATAENKRVSVSLPGYPLSVPSDVLVKVQLPDLAFFLNDRSRDTIDAFRAEQGSRVREVPQGKASILVFSDYTLEEAAAISSIVTTNSRGPVGTTSIQGLRSFLTAVKILTAFLATHTYSGFKTTGEEEDHQYSGNEGPIAIETRITNTCPLSSHRHSNDDIPDESVTFHGEPIVDKAGIWQDHTSSHYTPGIHGVATAKPSPLPASVNFGFASAVPADLPGLVFPYFEGLVESDGAALSNIMQHYFFRNFGETADQCHANFTAWRRQVSDWIRSASGQALSHMFFGVKLALESQTRVYIVMEESRYAGFVLLGGNFFVSAQGEIIYPLVGQALRQEIRALSAHQVALEEIAGLLSEQPKKMGGRVEEVEMATLRTGRDVMNALWEREEFSGEKLETMKKHVAKLHFTKPDYLVPTVVNVKRLITVIADPDSTDFDEEALYINPGRLYQKDRRYTSLAAFGPTAPSFVNAQGTSFPIVSPTENDVASQLIGDTGKKSMEVLIMTMKPIEVALEDWKLVMRDYVVKVNQMERAAPSRTYVYNRGTRDDLWDHLKMEIGGRKIVARANGGTKRGRDDSDEDGNPAPRKGKAKATNTFNLLAF